MIRSLKDFFRGLWVSKTPRFQHLQVEVTTRCDLPGCLITYYPAQNYFYGNIEAQDFSVIRQQLAYQEFTTVFRNRVAATSSLLDDLVPNPENLSRQDNRDQSRLISDPRFPWPPVCRGCYKSLGV